MKSIKQFAKKPTLIPITLDDSQVVEEYGEPITFYMMDHVDINTYFDFFRSQSERDGHQLNSLLRQIILDESGEPALAEDETLPIDLSIAALTKINETLGKSKTKSSMVETGTAQN